MSIPEEKGCYGNFNLRPDSCEGCDIVGCLDQAYTSLVAEIAEEKAEIVKAYARCDKEAVEKHEMSLEDYEEELCGVMEAKAEITGKD